MPYPIDCNVENIANDAPDDDTDNEFDDGPSDDEIARQADDRASKRRR